VERQSSLYLQATWARQDSTQLGLIRPPLPPDCSPPRLPGDPRTKVSIAHFAWAGLLETGRALCSFVGIACRRTFCFELELVLQGWGNFDMPKCWTFGLYGFLWGAFDLMFQDVKTSGLTAHIW